MTDSDGANQPLAPDAGMIAAFAAVLFRYSEGWVAVRAFPEKGDAGRPARTPFVAADADLAAKLVVEAEEATKKGLALYVVGGVVSAPGKAKAADVVAVETVLVDLDHGDVSAKREHLVTHLGPPALEVTSGGITAEGQDRLHLYWKLNEPATGADVGKVCELTLGSGAEQRNILWANSRGKWNISTGIRSREEMLGVIGHFHVVKGRGYSFRFKDWNDYDAVEVAMVEVSPTVWQLVKRYNVGGYEHVRTITKPVLGTVAIKIGGSPVTPSSIDHQTGLVTFGSVPGSAPTATFQFDVPVRFDTDSLPVQANAWDQQIASAIDLVEVLE